jgi:protein TonB
MFEQSIVQQQRTKPWTFGVSMTFEAAVVGALMMLSVLQVQRLDMVKLPPILPPIPRLPDAVTLVPVPHGARGFGMLPAAARALVAPTSIPHAIAKIEDVGSSAPEIGTIEGTASPDGVPYGNALTAMQTSTMPTPKAPTPQVRAAAAEPNKAPVRVSLGVMEAMLIHRVIPPYPPIAKTMGIQGKVRLQGIIGKDGHIQALQVIDGHPLLVRAAVDAVKQWVYRPTLLSGEPVEVSAPIEVNFVLAR